MTVASCSEDGSGNRADHVQLVTATHRPTGMSFVTTRGDSAVKFFSKQNLRATNFSGNIDPKLNKPAGRETGGFLNFSGLNTPGQNGANREFQIEIESEDVLIEPLRRQQVIGGQWQANLNNARDVSLNYDNEPIEQIVQDIFGGILGVNYIVSESVEGNVTFRSEQKFSQSELIQITADILARSGYLVQYFNSVYHIGLPDELDTLTGLRGRTALEKDESYVITLRNSAPENIADIAGALIPPGNTITAVPQSPNLLVRGDPSQFQSIEGLVRSLAGTGSRRNVLAIIPLRRSAPEAIATQLAQIYESRNLGDVSFLPLEQRQGILVIASTQKSINEARALASGLDVDSRDTPKLRVIQLTFLNAQETADQLSSVFGDGAGGGAAAAPAATNSNVVQSAIDLANAGTSAAQSSGASASVDSNDDGISLPVPRFLRRIVDDEGTQTASNGDAAGRRAAQSVPAQAPSSVTIAADERNNSLLVRSTYAEFKRISAAVKTLDVPLAQVVIEATIVEVLINDSLQYGVQAFLQSNTNTLRSAPTTGGAADGGGAGFVSILNGLVGGASIQTVLTALQSVSDVKVISSPYLTVRDGATSRLSVGDQVPFVTASQTSNSNGNVTVTQEVSARDIGVILQVTPKIAPDNSVVMDILQEVSSSAIEATGAGDNPTVSQRSVESTVTVNSGATILLGGLIQERSDITTSGVPVLSKIPVVGEAFKQTSNNQRRSELLILITPRVVRNTNQVQDVTNQLKWLLTTR